jgi:hypothetical protein
MHTGFLQENFKERVNLEDSYTEGRIILKQKIENRIGVWTGFMWRALVNTVMNFLVP